MTSLTAACVKFESKTTVKSLLEIISNDDVRRAFCKLDEGSDLDKLTDTWLDAFRKIQPCENNSELEMVLVRNPDWLEVDEFSQVHIRQLGDKDAYCQDYWEAYVRDGPDGKNMLFEMSPWNEILSYYVSESTVVQHGAAKICAHAILGAICLESDMDDRQKFIDGIVKEGEKVMNLKVH